MRGMAWSMEACSMRHGMVHAEERLCTRSNTRVYATHARRHELPWPLSPLALPLYALCPLPGPYRGAFKGLTCQGVLLMPPFFSNLPHADAPVATLDRSLEGLSEKPIDPRYKLYRGRELCSLQRNAYHKFICIYVKPI